MKPRGLDIMGDALSLVRKSDLAGATAIIRRALSGEAPANESGEPKARPDPASAKALPPPARRSLGETLRALRARPPFPPAAPVPPPEAEPAPDLGERFLRRTYRGAAGSLAYRLYVPADQERRRPGPGADAAWLHAESRGFRARHANEHARRRVRPHCRLSAPNAARQPERVLELVRPAPSEPRLGRTRQARRSDAGAGEGVRHPERARFRGRPFGGRRDGGDSRRDLPRCVRGGRDPLGPAL